MSQKLTKEECLSAEKKADGWVWRDGKRKVKRSNQTYNIAGTCIQKTKLYPYAENSSAHLVRSAAFRQYNEDIRNIANKWAVEHPEHFLEAYGDSIRGVLEKIQTEWNGKVCGDAPKIKGENKNWTKERKDACRIFADTVRGGKKVGGKTIIKQLPQSGVYITLANRLSRSVAEGTMTENAALEYLNRTSLTTPSSAHTPLGKRSPSNTLEMASRAEKGGGAHLAPLVKKNVLPFTREFSDQNSQPLMTTYAD